jgi:tetratricopeptide (TPR) repeat protein
MHRPAGPSVSSQLSGLMNCASQSLNAGHSANAILALQDATRIAPRNAPIHHDLGYLCLQAGRLTEAIAALGTALRLDPCFVQAHLCLGIALQDQGDTAGALAAYRHAISLQPTLSVAHLCLGALLESLGEHTPAIVSFRSGAASGPASLWGRLSNARALVAANRDVEAESVLRELLALYPANAMAHEMLATLFANTGRFENASDCYERAIAAAPQLAGSYYDLARCRRITRDDTALLARMRAALDAPGLTADARVKVHLALGKALDDLGDPAGAMQHFDDADALRSKLQLFDAVAFERRVDRLIAHFTPDLVARASDRKSGEATAVLIMGLPRSGTTLVEQILSSHPQVHGGGELPFWTERGARWETAVSGGAEPAGVVTLGSEYSSLLHALAPQAVRVTDKMPLNILWAGLIHLALPAATLIHCRRTPIDIAMSIHRTYFNPSVAFPTGGDALVATIRAVARLTAHWRAVLPPNRFVEVDYEQLVRDPEPAIRRLIAACDLSWDEACLRPEHNLRIIKTPSKWQARQPIHGDAVDSWRRYEPWLGPLAAAIPAAICDFPRIHPPETSRGRRWE